MAPIGLAAQSPTWSEDIACVVFTHCTPCHRDGGPGHFELSTYDEAYFWRNEMQVVTQAGIMPPWPPDPAYRSLAHERTLSQDEIDLIAAWVAGGAPEGPLESAPAPPVFTSNAVITDPDITAIMNEYAIPPSTSDNYRTFVLPINNPTDSYITGLEVIPGNSEMVHHVLVYQDTTGEARVLDEADIEPGYASFGGIGVESAKLVGIWVPGAEPVLTPPGMGIKLFANADLVMQIHYPATSTNEADTTRVNIALAPGGFLRNIAIEPVLDHYFAITDGPLIIQPNEVRSFHAEFVVPFPSTITAIGPHSHLLGRSMKSFAVLPDGDTIPLIDIPDWDFRWQGLYNFKRPIYLPTGTVLYGEAWYDNTAENEDNPNSPPALVWLGEATTDEMMLFYLAYTYGFPSDTSLVVDASTHTPHYLNCTPQTEVGLVEPEWSDVMSIRPSPASDVLYVSTRESGTLLTMRDMSGRIVRQVRSGAGTTTVSVADLARGMYSVQCLSASRAMSSINVLLE